MKITMPARLDGTAPQELDTKVCRSILIVGANGAGKTRFTRSLIRSLGDKAYPLSALDALYTRHSSNELSPLSAKLPKVTPSTSNPNDLEILLSVLMHDEMLGLIGYKLALAEGKDAHLSRTPLDAVVELWQDVFPGNRVLIDSGKILFARGVEDDVYSSVRLSDGERAVLFYAAAVQYAPKGAVVFIDSPEMFLHPSITASLWNRLETARPDCVFCYTTHDTEFASSRNGSPVVWVQDCDPSEEAWEYLILPPESALPNDLYISLTGARKPVLFIEGDSRRSIDAKLYPLIFPDFTVRSLGSCNKVIEATRTFNDLSTLHKMDSFGIVDRDRRDDTEVAYLRRKKVMVPDVAEIENLLLLEEVIRVVAEVTGHNADRVFGRVRQTILNLFRGDLRQQALLHTRHRVKRTVEYRVDARFSDISMLEDHLAGLLSEIDPRTIYEQYLAEFKGFLENKDYHSVLKVFNQKSMLSSCNVAQMCGLKNKEHYINTITNILRHRTAEAKRLREAIRSHLLPSD